MSIHSYVDMCIYPHMNEYLLSKSTRTEEKMEEVAIMWL